MSKQSAPLESRLAFEKAVAFATAKHAIGAAPRPPTWVGYRIAPGEIGFWQDRAYPLHDCVVFRRQTEGWTKTQLYPYTASSKNSGFICSYGGL